jgi:hypothetical protein
MVLPSEGQPQAIATYAIGTSSRGEYSPMNGETDTFTSVYHNGTVLAPATHVSACELSSDLLRSLESGS